MRSPGAAPVVILRYSFWERRYAKDPHILGHTVRINGEPATIIGVMPRGFSFPQNQDLWMPLVPSANVMKRQNRDTWFVFGRLADGVSVKSATAEMETIGRRLAIAYPLTNQGPNLLPHVKSFDEFFIGPNSTTLYQAMLVAVGFVLLIACANLANLLLARAIGRTREISVRIALGAGRFRIIRQLLIESLMLSVAGGLAGWWIARWAVRIYALGVTGTMISDSIGGNWFDNVLDYTMDYQVFFYLVAISFATGILFGLAPAARLARLDANTALKDGGRGATGGTRARHLSDLLVIGEMALAVVLLAGAGVMIRSFLKIYTADIGVKTENVLAAAFNLPKDRYPRPESQISFYDRLKTRLESVPGVESVAAATDLPTAGARRFPYELAGAEPVDERRRPTVPAVVIAPDYFKTMGAPLRAGRDFTDSDGVSGAPAAIVNERFASQYWNGEDPLGKRLRLFNGTTPESWLTVVGVAPEYRSERFHPPGDRCRDLSALPAEAVAEPLDLRPHSRSSRHAGKRIPPGNPGAGRRYAHLARSIFPVRISGLELSIPGHQRRTIPDLRRHRITARLAGPLRGDRPFGKPAHPGNWHQHGRRRHQPRHSPAGIPPGYVFARDRSHHRVGRILRGQSCLKSLASANFPHRSDHPDNRLISPNSSRDARLPDPGPPRDARRSRSRPKTRIAPTTTESAYDWGPIRISRVLTAPPVGWLWAMRAFAIWS